MAIEQVAPSGSATTPSNPLAIIGSGEQLPFSSPVAVAENGAALPFGDNLLAVIESAVGNAIAATNVLAFTSAVVSGLVTINGVVITFDNSPSGPYAPNTILTSGSFPSAYTSLTLEQAAARLSTLINGTPTSPPFNSGTPPLAGVGVSAVSAGGAVTVTALTTGSGGNTIAVSTSVSGAAWATPTLTGGSGQQGVIVNAAQPPVSSITPGNPQPVL